MSDTPWKLIVNAEDLEVLCREIKNSEGPIPLDLEADSMHCYFSKICLIQITLHREDYIIDPLVITDLSPLLDALNGRDLIIHGSDYDLRMMRDNWNFAPRSVWDTMLAARYLGEAQFGLASVIHHHFNVELDKTSQKADWSKRPLSQEMLDYAALDTHYLLELHQIQKEGLIEKGRIHWLEEHCQSLLDQISKETPHEDPERWRIKGSSLLNRKQLALLKALWEWREERARAKDVPPFKILPNEKMIWIARNMSIHPIEVENLGKMPKNLGSTALKEIIEQMAASVVDPETYPKRLKHRPNKVPSPHPILMEKLRVYREGKGKEFGIDEHLLANRAQLVFMALNQPQSYEECEGSHMMKWQWQLWEKEVATLSAK